MRKNRESKKEEKELPLRSNNLEGRISKGKYGKHTTKFVLRRAIKMRTKMGEEQSDRILTFKFNYNTLFLTTKVLQILLVLV